MRQRPAGPVRGMRRYWDDAARRNAAWYVDTSLEYDAPDMQRFLDTGRRTVTEALTNAPVRPVAYRCAVEIGSGLGRICAALADHFDEVVGVDISAEMVQRAHALVDRPTLRFMVGDGASLTGLGDGYADFVMSFTVFQHIPQPNVVRSYVLEAGRVLRPGGVFAFQWNATPGSGRWRLRRAVRATLDRLGWRADPYGRDAPQFLGSRIPLADVRRWLSDAGMELAGTRDEGTLFTWAWARKR